MDWLEAYYADVDAMRLDEYVEHHTDDAVVTFANMPSSVGKDQIREAIGGFWSTIGGLRHEIHHRLDDGDRTIIQATCHYTTKGGAPVPIPVASALTREGDKVSSLTVYIDLAPLFAAAAAEAEPATA
jgi:ketosteroid isomerase-like protein